MREIKYLLVLILVTVLYSASAHFFSIDTKDSIFFIGFLWILPISIYLGKGILKRYTDTLENKLKKKEKKKYDNADELEEIQREKKYLEGKRIDLSRLYTITKEMSFNVRFIELFKSLENFAKDNFKFKNIKILLFKYKNDRKYIDKIYEINRDHSDYIKEKLLPGKLINFVLKSKDSIFVKERKDLSDFGLVENTKNMLTIPLDIQRKTIASFLIEDIEDDDRDKYLILASQFALQIERVRLFENVERMSIIDGLTGVYLRRYFLGRLKEEFQRARQSKSKISFIMLDLDYFKKCNDNLGHLVGDVVLKDVAGVLQSNVREIDLIARYGGEEFCILLPEADKTGAHLVGERIRKVIEDRVINAYDEKARITLSMGISSFPQDSGSETELIENADKALYEAKESGRNRICLA